MKMSKGKKIMGVICSLCIWLMLIGGISVQAAGTGSITLNNTPATSGISIEGRTFKIYQLLELDGGAYTVHSSFNDYFTGTKTLGDGSQSSIVLSDINNIITYIQSFETNMNAFTEDLEAFVRSDGTVAIATSSPVPSATLGVETITISSLDYGYYFILDDETGLVRVAGAINTISTDNENLEITVKGSAPTIEKVLKDNDDDQWDKIGDYQIGDTIEYKITSTIPTDITGYENYTYIVTDIMDTGLTYNNDVKVYKDEARNVELDTKYFTATTISGGFKVEVNIIELKENENLLEEIYIFYTADLNENITVDKTSVGIENNVTLTYSNNPFDENSTGEQDDTVWHHTFQIEVFKTLDNSTSALEEAVFALYVVDGGEVQLYLTKDVRTTTTADGTVSSVPVYTISNGVATDNNGALSQGVAITPVNGRFVIVGLDDNITYRLREIEAPAGINTIDDIDFRITAGYQSDGTLDDASTSVSPSAIFDFTENRLATNIINTSTSLLPSTGGIGGIILKILGVGCIIGAVVLFVVQRKRKMQGNA